MDEISPAIVPPAFTRVAPGGTDLWFAAYTVLALLVVHAICFFLHEYSHSTTAWLMGFKSNPLAINYGHFDLSNVLLQQDMDENVDYGSMFASGHGLQAALIALAGAAIGNGLLYVVLAAVLTRQASQMRPAGVLFLFWLAVAASGNLWSYAPVRTITTHADMATAARGFSISSWTLLPFVVLPSLLACWHLFRRLLPRVLGRTCGRDPLRGAFVAATACAIFFGFYGCPGLLGHYGNASAVVSILSIFAALPLMLMATLPMSGLRRMTAA
jgi:hypothetical protein